MARLSELLNRKLVERQARQTGLCPVREELFQECFDELIRQVTLNEPEQGLLLLRVRDYKRRLSHSLSELCLVSDEEAAAG